MKRLAIAVLVVAGLWSAYWFFQAQSLRGTLEGWFEARRADGWAAGYSDLAIRGFPNRLDVTFSDLTLANPDTKVVWEAPFFQMLSLVYNPGHWILVWPGEQQVGTDRGQYVVTSEGLRASLVSEDDRILRANLEAAVLNITGPDGIAVAGLAAGIAAVETAPERLRFGISADSVAGVRDRLPVLPGESLDGLNIQAEVGFDRVWLREALGGDRPQPTQIDLKAAEYRLDGLLLRAAGKLDVDGQGRLDGDMTLRAENWREMLKAAKASGQMPENMANLLEQTLGLVAQLGGNKQTLDLRFRIDEGRVSLGLIPLGQAPRLRLR